MNPLLIWWTNAFFTPDLILHHSLWFVVGMAFVGLLIQAVVVVAAAYAAAFAAAVVVALTGKALLWVLSRRLA